MSGYTIEDAEIIHVTYHDGGDIKAVCVQAPEFDEDTWIPYSQIHDDSPVYRNGDKGDLIVKTWWAEKEGWL